MRALVRWRIPGLVLLLLAAAALAVGQREPEPPDIRIPPLPDDISLYTAFAGDTPGDGRDLRHSSSCAASGLIARGAAWRRPEDLAPDYRALSRASPLVVAMFFFQIGAEPRLNEQDEGLLLAARTREDLVARGFRPACRSFHAGGKGRVSPACRHAAGRATGSVRTRGRAVHRLADPAESRGDAPSELVSRDGLVVVRIFSPRLCPRTHPRPDCVRELARQAADADILYVGGHMTSTLRAFVPAATAQLFARDRYGLVVLDSCWSCRFHLPALRRLDRSNTDVICLPERMVTGSVASFLALLDGILESVRTARGSGAPPPGDSAPVLRDWSWLLARMNQLALIRAEHRLDSSSALAASLAQPETYLLSPAANP